MKRLRILILTSSILSVFWGCDEDNFRLESNADDFFFLENKEAFMPVWVQGNTASRTFVIHVHGGPGGESLLSFNILGESITEPLEEAYANVYYDQRNSGSSQGTSGNEYITEEQFSEDLYKLILLLKDKYGTDIKIYLLGTSWGGRLTANYLLNERYQSEVSGWISVAGDPDVVTTANSGKDLLAYYARAYIDGGRDESDWKEIRDWAIKTDTIISYGEWGVQNSFAWDAMKLVDDSLDHETPIKVGKALRGAFFSPVNLSSVLIHAATFSEEHLDLFDDLGEQLSIVEVPSLFMYGKFDFVVPPAVGQKAFDHVGSSHKKLVIFEHSGHLIPFNETEKFLDELFEFIRQNG